MVMKLQSFVAATIGSLFLTSCLHREVLSQPAPQDASTVRAAIAEDLRIIPRGIDFSKPPEVVAFGSCADQNSPQPIWKSIGENSPDLFLFMGDNIYASGPGQKSMSEQYWKLSRITDFRSFREKVPFMVTWDDGDYGQRDGGADFNEKEASKKEFLRFWPYVKDSLAFNQGGIYHAKIIGGAKKKQPSLQVIMLDTRYFRSPLKANPDTSDRLKKYVPNDDPQATILGQEQWQWLEEQLHRPADVRLIVSSIQLIPEGHGFEKWSNFPKEKEKFLNLLKRLQVKNVFILSGDRHLGIISKQNIKDYGTLWEVTASSLNRSSDLNETDSSYVGTPIKTENFGLALIQWKKRKITFQLKNAKNEILNSVDVPLKLGH